MEQPQMTTTAPILSDDEAIVRLETAIYRFEEVQRALLGVVALMEPFVAPAWMEAAGYDRVSMLTSVVTFTTTMGYPLKEARRSAKALVYNLEAKNGNAPRN